MAETVIYKPIDIQAWLKLGSQSLKQSPMQRTSDLRKVVTGAVGKAFDYGKSALADVGGMAIDRIEYRLHEDHLELVGVGATKSIPYEKIRRIEVHGKGYRVEAGSSSFVIKPYAHLLVSGVKIPLGWKRNKMDVAFHLLADEIAARAKVDFEEAV